MPNQSSGTLDALKRVEITGHQQHGSIEIFHLRWPGSNGLDYVTLDEALEARWIEITEFTEAGQVPRIKIDNRSDHLVFLMAGEQLVGCKQNRVLNASIMVPARSEMPLPVTCVERGRWGYSSRGFSSGHSSSHYRLRAMMAAQAAESYRQEGVPEAGQRAVWREVSRKLGVMGSKSPSDALQEVFGDYDRELQESVEKLPAPAGCSGAVFVVAGRIAGADLFDNPDTLRKLWPKLIQSCTIDALEPLTESPAAIAPEEISSWLERGARATQESFPSPGVGQDVRIEGEDLIGACLVVEDHPVHMELFRRTEPRRTQASGQVGAEPQQPASADGPAPEAGGRRQSWLRRLFW
ncbi:MAG: hypothetical protein HY236_10330 [Acidobacteria bacterium]|nr:hypothetical protein [Acidobacteriota bacterium]